MESPQRILVVRGGALGDFVVTLPVLAALRTASPNSHLAILCKATHGALAEAGGCIDEWRDLDGREWAGFFVPGDLEPSAEADWLASFDRVISFLHDPREVFHGHVERLTGQTALTGCPRPVAGSGKNASVILLEALAPLGLHESNPVPVIKLPGGHGARDALALHPGSGSEAKNWPLAQWENLIGRLKEDGRSLLLIGGECEAESVAALAHRFALPALINEPLDQVATKLAGCSGLVGHDSGISHLAAALGLPCVCLWADTDQIVWRPAGDSVNILMDEKGIESIPVEAVLSKIKKCVPHIDN